MMSKNDDDYIGNESCIDLQNDIVVDRCEISKSNTAAFKSSSRRKEKRELPPPIPHMPCVLRRYYTSDGRLILKKEKVKHHECFRAHRANGRLTMHLEASEKEEEAAPTPLEISTDININSTIRLTDEGDESSIVENDINGGSSSSKWSNCNRVRSSPSSCVFGVPVHPLRTVQG